MKLKNIAKTVALSGISFLAASNACAQFKQASINTMESTFRCIPDSQKIAVYWYWMSDNISKEGVVKDLQAMKRVGINRVQIGNIGSNDIAYGKVKFYSPEWWEVLHTALKTAGDLGIEVGIFNSPGWSQSGGPWVKPNQAMRYLAESRTSVTGGKLLKIKLPEVGKEAEDVKVLAFPDLETPTSFKAQQEIGSAKTIDFHCDKPATVRSITFECKGNTFLNTAALYAKIDNEYKFIRNITLDRRNAELNVGFVPFAPIAASVPETTSSDFRLVFNGDQDKFKNITLSENPVVDSYAEKTLEKMWQTPHPFWYDYMWKPSSECSDAKLVMKTNQVIDLTENFKDGVLTWNAPKGKWVILRTAMRPTGTTNAPATPEATGYETDKMSKKHIASHFDAFLGEIMRRIPPQDRKTFKIVVEDSYETGGQNWTDEMIPEFKKRYGYDPVPFIPTFYGYVVNSEDQSDRFLWDVRRLIADMVSYEYVGGLKKISNEHGLTTWLECYGHWGFPGEFLQYGGQSDEIAGEFWSAGDLGDIENRIASSCGHIYGKRRVWAESFTCGGPDFSRYPGEMKQRGDKFFAEGINNTLYHLYIQQPDDNAPGINAPFGNEFNRLNTWFSQLDVFNKYIKRCNYMLQQGYYVADVAYYIGEDAPKMTGIRNPEIPQGYSYDFINAEVIEKSGRVENGQLAIDGGMKYRVLVLPPQNTMRPEFLAKLQELVKNGLTIIGPKPEKSPSLQNYPEADKKVSEIATKMWGGEKYFNRVIQYGKGKVYPQASIEEVMADMNVVPDFKSNDPTLPITFLHRSLPDADVYFVANQGDKAISFNGAFRAAGKTPELWNPQTAEVRALPQFTRLSKTVEVPMKLEPLESAFIVFRNGSEQPSANSVNYPEKKVLTTITTPWKVAFEQGKGGPESTQTFETLTDWSKNADNKIKYFAGHAIYTNTFKISKLPEGETYIDLGKVMVMAKVKINGEEVGGVWTPPYRLNITKYLKKGVNTLEVDVVNNWRNRLIGEKNMPESERFTKQSFTYLNKDSELQESGLIGPVEIQNYSYELKK